MSCYFDDFVIASTPQLAVNSQQTVELLDLLGWAFDKAGPKAHSFSQKVSALGATDLNALCRSFVPPQKMHVFAVA